MLGSGEIIERNRTGLMFPEEDIVEKNCTLPLVAKEPTDPCKLIVVRCLTQSGLFASFIGKFEFFEQCFTLRKKLFSWSWIGLTDGVCGEKR